MVRFTNAQSNPAGFSIAMTDQNGSGTLINMSASTYYGDGSKVTGIPGTTNLEDARLAVATPSSGSAVTMGAINKVDAGAHVPNGRQYFQIIGLAHS